MTGRIRPGAALGAGAEELRALASKSRDVVLLSAIVGLVTGLGVALLDSVVVEVVLERVLTQPLGIAVLAPVVGLVLTALVLRYLGGGVGPSTTDEYIKAVPHPELPFDLRPVPARTVGAVTTLGMGAAAGLEGPAIYLGSAVGIGLVERGRRWFGALDRRAALVAGAAAGVAAIFKAPATGAVFALEVPYQEDLAQHSLLPALVGAAAGYVGFVGVHGTDPIIPVSGDAALTFGQLAIAATIGLACGVGARVWAAIMGLAKSAQDRFPLVPRLVLASLVIVALGLASDRLFDGEILSLGPGYRSIEYALDPGRGLWLIALLATIRALATASAVSASGVAGMFVPLVVQGALTGRLLSGLFHVDNQSLCVVIGVAAFLGAGYRVPLAAVMFVAEATGRPGFVVPGLIAATVAQLAMGSASVSPYQRRRRLGVLEERADQPIATVLSTDPASCSPDDSVAHFFTEHVALARRRAVPVTDGDGIYLGLVVLEDVLLLEPSGWGEVTVAEVARTDVPTAGLDWTLGMALQAMVDAGVDHLPVVDPQGRLRGLATGDAIVDRAELLDRLAER